MTDQEFDAALIAAAFADVAVHGWRGLSIPRAAADAGLDLSRVRLRFPDAAALLLRFGTLADQSALAGTAGGGTMTARERLFDMLMLRFDVLQSHRPGVLALMQGLPLDPSSAALLGIVTLSSMRFLAQAAGLPAGFIQAPALVGVWLWTLRRWRTDESPDLSATMATLDTALARAFIGEAAVAKEGQGAALDPPGPEAPDPLS